MNSEVLRKALFLLCGIGALTPFVSPPIALALGLALALLVGNPYEHVSGRLSKALLQWSVVGLGFGMNLSSVWVASKTGFALTVMTIAGTLLFGWILGRALKMDRTTSLLISSGTAICGGSAIAAVGGVLDADRRAMSVSLGTVFILNAVALFIFPVIGHALQMGQQQFGLWAAIAIHDTSSVVGAATKYGDQALEMATNVKLARALWIFPIAIGLALTRPKRAGAVKFPWFILWFLAAAAVCTYWPRGGETYQWIVVAAKRGLTLTLFLIGATLSREAIKSVGLRPLIQGVLLWILVGATTLLAIEAQSP